MQGAQLEMISLILCIFLYFGTYVHTKSFVNQPKNHIFTLFQRELILILVWNNSMFNKSMSGQDFRLSLYATNVPCLVFSGWRNFCVFLIIKYGCISSSVNFIFLIRVHNLFCRGSIYGSFPVDRKSIAFFVDFKMNL